MCIFSGRVRSVSDTNIFARLSGRRTQFLVYSMKYSSEQPVAMILPLPVASPAKRLGIRFINFKAYEDFFNDVEHGFPQPVRYRGRMEAMGGGAPMARPTIHVESVGDFIASYVPTLDDFDRVDRRFRLPRTVWNKIPAYADYGFAVFQLKDTAGKGGALAPSIRGIGAPGDNDVLKVHPMAFEFHTRFPDTLYYPTVHIHDEQVHPVETFDHSLYFQDAKMRPDFRGVTVSGPLSLGGLSGRDGDLRGALKATNLEASYFVECAKTQGAVDPNGLCYKLGVPGARPNKDTLVRVG